MQTSLLHAARLLLHVAVAVLLTTRSAQIGAVLHPFQRALANDWVRLLFYVDATKQIGRELVSVTLPHFLLEIEEEVAASLDDEFFGGGFAARASALPVGALFTIDETRQHLHGVVANYFRLADVALDSYLLFGNSTTLPPPQLMVRADIVQATVDTRYNITHTHDSQEWPASLRLDGEAAPSQDTREFFDQLDAMQLSFVVGMKHKEQQKTGETQDQRDQATERLYEWRVAMRYDLQNQGHLEVTMNYELTRMRLLQQGGEEDDEEGDKPPISFDNGTLFDWIMLLVISLYQVNTRFHILGLTLRRGLPRVAQFLVGVLPIFVGFVLFGTVMFGAKVPRFQSASATATTLFSVANGDEIHDTFNDVAYTPWIGQIYVFSYMILFSYVVLMVCIGIIEDAFFSAVFPASWPTLDKTQHDGQQAAGHHQHPQGGDVRA
ncbi:hypothetical protein BBJ28_00010043 [Nothophytophthora sp. Chile5]|nr:hypothetical protein BBJ28_00010043 [Nothophytophthora sp. Chile5]